MSNVRRRKSDRKQEKNLEKIDEAVNEEHSDEAKKLADKKLLNEDNGDCKQGEECIDSNEDNIKHYSYEFIYHVLQPYKKMVYFLIQSGYLKERTPHCKHKIKSCYLNSLEGFCTNFFYGFMVKAAINILLGVLSPKKKLIPNIIDLFSADCMSFCTFLGALSGIYKFSICSLRRFRGDEDQLNSLISGALAGLSLFFESSEKRKKFVLLYLFVRAVEMLINVLDKKGYIKKIKYFE